MDDDEWGEDLDLDMVEECVILASQAVNVTTPTAQEKPKGPEPNQSFNHSFQFKSPPPQQDVRSASESSNSSVSASDTSLLAEIERLKEENRKLTEENLVKSGESSILRSDVMQLRLLMDKREQESSNKLVSLKKQAEEAEARFTKQLEACRTEMKFKELELEETRSKCKRIEATASPVTPQPPRRPVQDVSPPNKSRFLNRTLFETSTIQSDRKRPPTVMTTEAAVQTSDLSWSQNKAKQFRLCNFHPEHCDPSALMNSLIFSLKTTDGESSCYRQAVDLMSEVRMRLNAADWMAAESSQWRPLLADNGVQVVELICDRLHQIKDTEWCGFFIEFLAFWIATVLPPLDRGTCLNRVLPLILSAVDKLDVVSVLTVCTAVVTVFTIDPLCRRISGCLMESAAMRLKEVFPTASEENQWRLASALVTALSAVLASESPASASQDERKCSCIPHLLRTLVLLVDLQTGPDRWPTHDVHRRQEWTDWMLRVFRLSLAIVRSRSEPWITFTSSQTEINRIFTVVTALTEIHLPAQWADEINRNDNIFV